MSKSTLFKLVLAIYIGLAVFRITDPNLKWVKPKPEIVEQVILAPTNIKIQKINLDLAVSPSVVKGNDWEVFDDRVAWLSTSAKPGGGNTILYAHDRVGLFQDLYKLKTGDEIQIYNDVWISYKVSEVKIVKPNDVGAILGTGNRLTLYTCNGTFDQKRLVVYAD